MNGKEFKINLTPKQIRFCQEYVIDWNGTRAAIAAGYSQDTATQMASENLRKPYIAEYIEEIKNKLSELSGVTALRNINELAKVAYSNISEMVDDSGTLKPFDELTDSQKAAISEIYTESYGETEEGVTVKRKIKLHSKLQAIDLLNGMLGYKAPQKTESTIKGRLDLVDTLFPTHEEIMDEKKSDK